MASVHNLEHVLQTNAKVIAFVVAGFYRTKLDKLSDLVM